MTSCYCPHCQAAFSYEENFEGRKIRCTECQQAFIAPPHGSQNVIAEPFPEESPAAPVAAPHSNSPQANRPRVTAPRKNTVSTKPPKQRGKSLLLGASALVLLGAAGFAWVHYKTSSAGTLKQPVTAFNLPAASALAEILPADPARAALKPSERVASYDEALVRAKETGNDIVVFQRGSDWNRLSEHLYQNVWSQQPFLQSLGNGFIVVAVDNQETRGGEPVSMTIPGSGDIRTGTTFEKTSPLESLTAQCGDKSPPPPSQITSLTTTAGVTYEKNDTGEHSIKGSINAPAKATLKLTLTPKSSGKFLRLDFPIGTPFVGKNAGLAENGNFALTAVRAFSGTTPLAIKSFEASAHENPWPVSSLPCNGSTTPGCWNPAAHHGQPRTLVAFMDQEIPAGTPITVELAADSSFNNHIPGSLRAAVVADQTAAIDYAKVPSCELSEVTTLNGSLPFERKPDGTFMTQIAPNPEKDTLVLKLAPSTQGRILRLDFPLDERAPSSGPGRAGNAVISEILITSNGKPVPASRAWGNNDRKDAQSAACNAVDGISDNPDEGWNINGTRKKARTLFVLLDAPAPAGALEVQLLCKSKWKAHIPTSVRACVIDNDALAAAITRQSTAEILASKNASYTWNDGNHCPRIALLDSQGRAVACENAPRIWDTAATLAKRIHELQDVREQRDEIWARAASASGPEKATLLVEGMKLLRRNIGDTGGMSMWDGNAHCYKTIQEEIEKADPKNESWAPLIYRTGLDSRCGLATLDPKMRAAGAIDYSADAAEALKAKQYEKALAVYNAMLAHPNFKRLDADLKQRVHLGKFTVYRHWEKHESEAIAVLKQIIALSEDTTLGKGAIGLLAYTHTTTKPDNFYYGWGGSQVQPGTNAFDFIRGLDLSFNAPGPFILSFTRTGGKGAVKVSKVTLMDGDKLLSEAKPEDNEISPAKPTLQVPLTIKPNDWRGKAERKLHLEVELTGIAGADGKVDSAVSLTAQRVVDEKPLATTNNKAPSHAQLLKELDTALAANSDIRDAEVLRKLIRREFITACGPAFLDTLRTLPGGAEVLERYGNDMLWLEEFLTSNVPQDSYAAAIDNMRVLHNHCQGLEVPVYLRLATAIALNGGNTSQVSMISAYDNYRNAHRDMMLYCDFEKLDLRSMRGVIDLSSPENFAFYLNNRQLHPHSGLGACHSIWYMYDSILGGSIFGGGYLGCFFHTPWNWCYPYGEFAFRTGGVCGTLSTFGSQASRISGIQSHNVGQPAHCAYVVRIDKAWHVGNYVSGPTGDGVPGWTGVGYNTSNTLQEEIFQDREAVIAAERQTWLAHWKRDQETNGVLVLPNEFKYTIYPARDPKMPDFTKLIAAKSGTASWPVPAALAPNPPFNCGYAAVWEGELEMTSDADIVIDLASQDESQIWIAGKNVCGSLRNPVSKTHSLKAGKHPIKIAYLQSTGRSALSLSIRALPAKNSWIQAYENAVREQPRNYGTWLEYIQAIKSEKQPDASRLQQIFRELPKVFRHDQEAAWALIQLCTESLKPALKPEQLRDLFLFAHTQLRYSNKYPHHGEGLNIGNIVAWQIACMPDVQMQLDFIRSILGTHFSEDPALNSYFGSILGWANNAYGNNPKISADYTAMIGRVFTNLSSSLDNKLVRTTIQGGIQNASKQGDLPAYRLWMTMAKKWLPAEESRWDAKQAKLNTEHAQPFPGLLLSPDGLIQCSAPSSILSFAQLQNEGQGASFYANKMKNPWITLQLGGESELSGIVLVGHQESFKTELPLKVSISTDNKTWTEVASITSYSPSIRVDLQGKALKARYVRVERPADAPENPIHLRNFLVYGKRLY